MEGYELFKSRVLKKTGLDLSLYKERQMKRRIESLVKRNKCEDFESYYKLIDTDKVVFDEFINYLTINVSEFYRNPNQWAVLKDQIIPSLLSKKRTLKVWSAACSTGEEPYTLVMTLSNFFPLRSIKILAVDIDKEALNKAQIGVYTEKSIENVPNEFKSKYFEKVGSAYKISNDIKNAVEFKHFNLLKDSYPKDCDLIVCRNVMIYFTEEAKDKMYRDFNNALANDGVLFVGSTEQIIIPGKYNFEPLKTFFYQKYKK